MPKRSDIDETSDEEIAERRFPLRIAAAFVATLALGALGALSFWVLHMPLPWLLGSMFVTSVAAIARSDHDNRQRPEPPTPMRAETGW